jgi:hypothetical protein
MYTARYVGLIVYEGTGSMIVSVSVTAIVLRYFSSYNVLKHVHSLSQKCIP